MPTLTDHGLTKNTQKTTRTNFGVVLLYPAHACLSLYNHGLLPLYAEYNVFVHIKISMFTTENGKSGYVIHIKISMFTTEIRKKTGMLYILKLVCLLLKYKKTVCCTY